MLFFFVNKTNRIINYLDSFNFSMALVLKHTVFISEFLRYYSHFDATRNLLTLHILVDNVLKIYSSN